jgi:hypothetical protein
MFSGNVMGILADVHGQDVTDDVGPSALVPSGPQSGPLLSAGELRDKLDRQRLKLAELGGRGASMRERQAQLTGEVALAKARQALAPAAIEFLDLLQKRLHEETLGEFRELTTSIVQDVFPGNNVATFSLYSVANAPALDIGLEINGRPEDILTMNGGAITNVICAGLRYIARERTDSRNFLGLDEPDCWLDEARVPAFIKVIADVSRVKSTQTLLVSHHPVEMLEAEGVSIIELAPDSEGKIVATPLNPQAPSWENDEQEGIRFIELINVGRHQHTYLPLFPGVNALSAGNQGGKSTVMAALRFVCYNKNDAGDGFINHDAAEAVVRIGVERGLVVEARIKREGSPKVQFSLTGPEIKEPREQRGERGKPAPDFVEQTLRMARVDGLDIHLAMQKEPVFLLNESSTARAKLLSVGRESGFLTAIREKHRKWVTRDNEKVREGEAELMGLSRKIAALEDLQGVEPLMKMVLKLLDEVELTEKAKLTVASLIAKLQNYESEILKLSTKAEVLANLPKAVPVLEPQGHLRRLIERMAGAQKIAGQTCAVTWPAVPLLSDNGLIVDLGRKIGALEKVVRAAQFMPTREVSVPGLESTSQLLRVATSMARTVSEQAELDRQHKLITQELAQARNEQDQLIDSLGGVCPLCGNTMKTHAH